MSFFYQFQMQGIMYVLLINMNCFCQYFCSAKQSIYFHGKICVSDSQILARQDRPRIMSIFNEHSLYFFWEKYLVIGHLLALICHRNFWKRESPTYCHLEVLQQRWLLTSWWGVIKYALRVTWFSDERSLVNSRDGNGLYGWWKWCKGLNQGLLSNL